MARLGAYDAIPNLPDAVSMAVISVEKAQWVRLLDAFVIGPGIIYYGRQANTPFGRLFMTAIGIGTILYNTGNYLANRNIPEVYPVTVRPPQ